MHDRGPRLLLAFSLAALALLLAPSLVPRPAQAQIGPLTEPAKDCSPTFNNTTPVCTITLFSPLPNGTTLVDTISGPAGSTITSCVSASGGLACGTPAGATVTITCSATPCLAGSSVQLQLTIVTGVLTESLTITLPGGGATTFVYSGQAKFGVPAPGKSCSPALPAAGALTTCTLASNFIFGPGDTVTDTVTGPAGATILACTSTTTLGGGNLICGTPTAGPNNSVTVTCVGGVPCTPYSIPIQISSPSPGPLTESVAVAGGAGTLYGGQAVFVGVIAPPMGEEKWCTNAASNQGLNQVIGGATLETAVSGPATSFTIPLFGGASTCWLQLTSNGVACGTTFGCADGYVTVSLTTPGSSAVLNCGNAASPLPSGQAAPTLPFLPNGGACLSQTGGTSIIAPCGVTAGTPAAQTTPSSTCSSVSFDIASLISGCLTGQTHVQACPLGSNAYSLTGGTATVTVSFQTTPANGGVGGGIVLGTNSFAFQGPSVGTLLVTATPQLIPSNGTLASVITATFACGSGFALTNTGFPQSAYFAGGISQTGTTSSTSQPILGGGSVFCGAGLPGTFTFATPGEVLFDNGRTSESVGCGLNGQQNIFGGSNLFNPNNLNPTLPLAFTCTGAAVLAIGGGAAGDAPINVTYASSVGGLTAVGSTLITVAPSGVPVISVSCNPSTIAGADTGSLCTATVTDQNGTPLTGIEGATVTWTVSDPKEAQILPCVVNVSGTLNAASSPNIIPEITPSTPCNPVFAPIPAQSVTFLNGQTTALLVASSYAHPEVVTVAAVLGVLVPPEYACEVSPYTPVGYGVAQFPGSAAPSGFLPGLTGCGAGNPVGVSGLASALSTAGNEALNGIVTLPNATNASTTVSIGGLTGILVLGATPGSPLVLLHGCNNVVVVTTAGTPIANLAALVSPPAAVVGIWAFNNTAKQFKAGFFRDPSAPVDFDITGVASGSTATSTVAAGTQATESYFMCVDEASGMSSG